MVSISAMFNALIFGAICALSLTSYMDEVSRYMLVSLRKPLPGIIQL